jgi:hypothetical protein
VFAPAFKEFLKDASDIGRRRPDLADATIKAHARKLERQLDRLFELEPKTPMAAIFRRHDCRCPRQAARLLDPPRC